MPTKVKVGDVFLIPLDDNYSAAGQVVSDWNGELYLAVFSAKFWSQDAKPTVVVESPPALLVLSLDAKIWHGHWPLIGNVQSNLGRFPQPVFKVRQDGGYHVESRDRTLSRPASLDEARDLQFRTVTSAAGVEGAVRAYFGMGEWSPRYEKMLAEHALMSSLVAFH